MRRLRGSVMAVYSQMPGAGSNLGCAAIPAITESQTEDYADTASEGGRLIVGIIGVHAQSNIDLAQVIGAGGAVASPRMIFGARLWLTLFPQMEDTR